MILWCWSLPLEGEAGCPIMASGLSDSVFRVVSGWTIPSLGVFSDISLSAVLSVALSADSALSPAVSVLVSLLLPVDSVLSVAVSDPISLLLSVDSVLSPAVSDPISLLLVVSGLLPVVSGLSTGMVEVPLQAIRTRSDARVRMITR